MKLLRSDHTQPISSNMTDNVDIESYNADNWFDILTRINRELRLFLRKLKAEDITTRAVYIDEWNAAYADITDAHFTQPTMPYQNASFEPRHVKKIC